MTNKLIVDSNVFISSFLAEESFHHISLQFLSRLQSSLKQYSLLLPRIVLLEVVNGLYKKTGHFIEVSSFLRLTDDDESVHLAEFDQAVQRSAYILLPKLRLKTLDLIIAVTAISSHATLISWDTALIKSCSTFIEAYNPDEFLKRNPKR